MATNSPMGTNPYLPPDIQLQQINLQRQQALADALRQQSLESTPSEVVSGRVVPKGILGAIAPLLRAGLANKTQDKVSQGQLGLTKAYSDYLTNSANATLPGGQQQMPSQPTGTTQDGQSVPTYQAPSGQPIGDAGGMSVPVTPNAQPPQAAVQAAGGPQISPQLRAAYVSLLRTGNMEGANKLMEMAWQSQMPNDTSKMAAAAGVDPAAANAAALRRATEPSPVVNRGYGIGTMVDGKYVPDPASLEQALTLERGKQGIELPYRAPVTMPTSSGQNATVFPSEFPSIQQGNVPQRLSGTDQAAIAAFNQAGRPSNTPFEVAPNSQGGVSPVGTLGLSQSQGDQINQERQRAGGKATDEAFAKDYVAWNQGGGADSAKQLAQLQDVSKALNTKGANLTGPFLGSTPDMVKKFTNPQSIAMRERVEEVVQRSLRSILGAQFTEKEGERLIARAYNPNLPEAENSIRVGRLFTQLQQAFQAKQDAAQYFEKNGTLQGWQGKLYNMGDFDNVDKPQQTSGNVSLPGQDAIAAELKRRGL